MSRPSQGNRGRGRGGGAHAILEKGKKAEIRMPVPGKGQASSSPISEDGNDKELLNSICQLHRQIRADHTPAKNIVSAIGKLKTEIQDLISELDDSEENTEAPKKPAKFKPGDGKAIASGTNKSKDLYTVATITKKKCRKLNSDLLETRKELKEISELAVAVGREVGLQPETSRADKDKDSLNLSPNKALEDIRQRNKKLSEELNSLNKKLESYSTDQTEQQPKQRNVKNQPPQTTIQTKKKKGQSEEKKDHKSSQFDTNLEIISKAVSSFDDLQKHKGKMDHLAKRTIQLTMKEGDQPIQDKTLLSELERAIGDIEGDIKKLRQLETKNRTFELQLSQVLDFAVSLEEMNAELIGSVEGGGALNPTNEKKAKSKKDEERSKRKEEGHDGLKADPPVAFDNKKFEQAIKLLPIVYGKLKDQLSKMDHLAKRTIQLTMKERDQPIQDKTLLSELERAIGDIEGDIMKLRHLETKNREEIQKLKREIEIKVKDNEALHNRLSKMAGNKMTAGNPNIANLGDPNRPTKIAEVYSEIYDNEWTDTLDFCLKELGKEYSEDEALQALNKTLIICYKICQEKSDEWIQKTKEKLQHCTRELMVNFQSDEILMQIIEGRKVVSDQMSQKLLEEIRPKKDLVATRYAKDKEMSSKLYKMIIQDKFFEKCFTLCWKMIVQNPRMILVEGPSKGETYDRNIFREFTSSGSKVVFTVWPALYLHKDGPLLVKGVLKVK